MSDIGTFKSKVKFDYREAREGGSTVLYARCRVCPSATMNATSRGELTGMTSNHKSQHWDQAVRNGENIPQPLERTA